MSQFPSIVVLILDYEQATQRQYQRLTKQLKPDMAEYEREKEKMWVVILVSSLYVGLKMGKREQGNHLRPVYQISLISLLTAHDNQK